MEYRKTEPLADDSTFHPIYEGARVRVTPGVSRSMGVEVPEFLGEVVSIDDARGVLSIREEGAERMRSARPEHCLVIRPRRGVRPAAGRKRKRK